MVRIHHRPQRFRPCPLGRPDEYFPHTPSELDSHVGAGAYSYQKSMGRQQKPGAEAIGTLDLLILSRLARGSMHGFGIAEYLHGVSDALHVEEGSLYPALHRLESQGLIKSQWGISENNRRARFYKLTPRGRRQVTVNVSNWRRMVEAVNRVIDPLVS